MSMKAVPTNLKVLRGNPSKRALVKDEPKPRIGLPDIPRHLDPIAIEEWEKTGPMLVRMGLLTEADGDLFGGYCQVVADLIRINEAMRACDYAMVSLKHTVDGAGNEHIEAKTNPLIVQRRQALQQLRFFCQEFGMTPSARSRMSVPGSGEVDPRKKYLDG